MFFGRNDAKAETPVLWPLHTKSWLIGKDSDAGKDCRQEDKGTTEDEMAGWRHWLDGREFEWTPGVSDGQGGLACCNSWSRKESDTTEQLNWTKLNWCHPNLCAIFLKHFTKIQYTDPQEQISLAMAASDFIQSNYLLTDLQSPNKQPLQDYRKV